MVKIRVFRLLLRLTQYIPLKRRYIWRLNDVTPQHAVIFISVLLFAELSNAFQFLGQKAGTQMWCLSSKCLTTASWFSRRKFSSWCNTSHCPLEYETIMTCSQFCNCRVSASICVSSVLLLFSWPEHGTCLCFSAPATVAGVIASNPWQSCIQCVLHAHTLFQGQ
jgi:hypothetical protein